MEEVTWVPQPARTPKHERIAEDLRALIRSGTLVDGDQLPGENALMEQYNVARMTARQALAALQNEGLAVARKGVGVFVRTFRPVRRHGNRRLSREVWGAGHSMWDADDSQAPTVDRLTVRTIPAPDHIARLLNTAPGAHVVARQRRYLVDGTPVQLATAYIPAELAEGTRIEDEDTGPGGVYARLAELGHPPVRFVEELRARMPTHTELEELELVAGTPVIQIARTAFGDDGNPIETSEMTLSSAAYALLYEFNA